MGMSQLKMGEQNKGPFINVNGLKGKDVHGPWAWLQTQVHIHAMGKPNGLTWSQTWAWCTNPSPNPKLTGAGSKTYLKPKAKTSSSSSLLLHPNTILRERLHHRRQDGERSRGGGSAATKRCSRQGGWCECSLGRGGWWRLVRLAATNGCDRKRRWVWGVFQKSR